MDISEGTKSYNVQMLQASVDKSYKVKNLSQFLQQAVKKIYKNPKLMCEYIVGHVFKQMMGKVGKGKHEQVPIDALFKKCAQLHHL